MTPEKNNPSVKQQNVRLDCRSWTHMKNDFLSQRNCLTTVCGQFYHTFLHHFDMQLFSPSRQTPNPTSTISKSNFTTNTPCSPHYSHSNFHEEHSKLYHRQLLGKPSLSLTIPRTLKPKQWTANKATSA